MRNYNEKSATTDIKWLKFQSAHNLVYTCYMLMLTNVHVSTDARSTAKSHLIVKVSAEFFYT